jgi:hypothetical protein
VYSYRHAPLYICIYIYILDDEKCVATYASYSKFMFFAYNKPVTRSISNDIPLLNWLSHIR